MTKHWKFPAGAIEDLEIVDVPFVFARNMGLDIHTLGFIICVIMEACATVTGYISEKPRSRGGGHGSAFAIGRGLELKLD